MAISLVSPLTGRVARTGSIVFEVTDAVSLEYHAAFAVYGDPYVELVFSSDDLDEITKHTVTRAAITNGYRYTVARKGGWRTDFTLRVVALDPSGSADYTDFAWRMTDG